MKNRYVQVKFTIKDKRLLLTYGRDNYKNSLIVKSIHLDKLGKFCSFTDSQISFILDISHELNGVSGQNQCRNLEPFERHSHRGMVEMGVSLPEGQVLQKASWKSDEVEYFK